MPIIPIPTNQILNAAKAVRVNFIIAIGNKDLPEGDPVLNLEQVSSKLLTNFPVTRVFEFRVTRTGTISKITFYAPENVDADITFDVNLGTRIANLSSLFSDPNDRPVLESGTFSIETELSEAVEQGDLISIDIDSASENLRYLSVIVEILTA